MNPKTEILLAFFKAIGQLDRLRILGLLANRPYTVPELAVAVGIKDTAVFHHIRTLQQANLVTLHTGNNPPVYTFNRATLAGLNDIINGTAVPQSIDKQVLERYVVNGRLSTIPHKPEERQVILQWMTEKFDPDRRYSETEVTDLIAEYFDKPLTLRRILADNRFLWQTGRHYWRPLSTQPRANS